MRPPQLLRAARAVAGRAAALFVAPASVRTDVELGADAAETLETRVLLDGVLQSGQTYSGAINPAGDVDYWTVSVNAGDSFRYALGVTGAYAMNLTIYRPNGSVAYNDSGEASFNIGLTNLLAGTYTIALAAGHPSVTTSYTHTIVKLPGGQSLPSDEGALTSGVTTSHQAAIGDVDLFTFTAAAGDSFRYALGSTSGRTLDLTIYRPDGSILYNGYNQEGHNVGVANLEAGVHSVVVNATDPFYASDYDQTFVRVPGPSTLPSDEGAFVLNQLTSHALTSGDIDLFAFDVETGDQFRYALEVTSGARADVTIYRDNGEAMYYGSDRTTVALTLNNLEAGSYFVLVNATDPSGVNQYRHGLTRTSTAQPAAQDAESIIGLANGRAWWAVDVTESGASNRALGTWDDTESWIRIVRGDFDGDGTTDIAGQRGSNGDWVVATSGTGSFSASRWGRWSTSAAWEDVLVADFNGDGKDDIAGRVNGNWWVTLSTGDAFSIQHFGRWSTSITWENVSIGDFNGDGRADIAGRANGNWWVSLSTGSAFEVQYFGRWSTSITWDDVTIGDFDGNGRTDIAGRVNGNWWISLSNGTSFLTRHFGRWSTSGSWQHVMVGDFNGDGRDDIAGRMNGNWWVAISTGAAFSTQYWGRWSTADTWTDVMVGDFDGDGRDDIAGRFRGSWWLASSNGGGFTNTYLTRWSASANWDHIGQGVV